MDENPLGIAGFTFSMLAVAVFIIRLALFFIGIVGRFATKTFLIILLVLSLFGFFFSLAQSTENKYASTISGLAIGGGFLLVISLYILYGIIFYL